ncbi:class I SAM-dependent methyltransferase [Corynebacterium tapiri]|uniref:SAM-dependent methyltransferase n=1 Tax=Corynebacterium tapiri TaxID=1448266 RepID=A0A5C4U4Z6_9CORY|nr:class I SAM-dependent methyltransferase [Corynebacterium tapiri]TNL97632.1 SAM-dependent methyltransferase [Corynebacterium tapiri]
MTKDHLELIDAVQWPAVAEVPSVAFGAARARAAEAYFALTCEKAGIELDPQRGADLEVKHPELFLRLALAGWTGLAESYMAGEWHADDLVDVLEKLIRAKFRPRHIFRHKRAETGVGELPVELTSLYSGDGTNACMAVFSSAVPTTVRKQVPSYVDRAGRGSEPAHHFVDVTTYAQPTKVERADLGDGQQRAMDVLLDAARVTRGTHLLEFPSSGGGVAIRAALRRASVDCLTGDIDFASAVKERLTLAGVSDSVRTAVRDSLYSGARDWREHYDAVVGVERLETLAPSQRRAYVRSIDRMLDVGGRAGLQTMVATDTLSSTARDALRVANHYLWPGLEYSRVEDLHRLVDKYTGLRIIGQTHFGSHAQLSLRLQRELLQAHEREAAAEGFDAVYRRLFDYQLALREALMELGMLDCVQLTLTHRNRGGRR